MMSNVTSWPPDGGRILGRILVATLSVFGGPAIAAEPEQDARREASPLPAGKDEAEHRGHGATPKREFRAIHNMDEMHRMGGAPGMSLEDGRIQMAPPGEPTKNPGPSR